MLVVAKVVVAWTTRLPVVVAEPEKVIPPVKTISPEVSMLNLSTPATPKANAPVEVAVKVSPDSMVRAEVASILSVVISIVPPK